MDIKSGAARALEAFSKRDMKQAKRRGKKNATPEKDLQRHILAFLSANNFSCHIVESKAVYSAAAGRYVRGQTISGMPDIIGCDCDGASVFIELKAPGRLRTLKEHQRDFLLTKIQKNAFAVCVDSVGLLEKIYLNWRDLMKKQDVIAARNYLITQLL